MKKYLVLIAVLAITSFNAIFSLAGSDPGGVADYEVHEWGVIAGCDEAKDYFLTSRPLQVTIVKEPVLYFHSNDKKPFSLKVTFNQGFPTDTYPIAERDGNVLQWKRVSFTEDAAPVSKGLGEVEGHVPLREIIDTLNDVDADEIYCNGVKSRFLFYEGEIPFANKIECIYGPDSRDVSVVNHGDCTVFDLFIISQESLGTVVNFFQKDSLVAYLPQLKPGEKARVKLELVTKKVDFAKSLRDLHFTDKEIKSFESLWDDPFLRYGKLVYRLPQDECDRMIRLEFEPRPKKIVRALYVLVKQ